jgi:hypothetical protein
MPDAVPASFQIGLPLWYLVHRGTGEIGVPQDPVTLGVSIGHVLVQLNWGDGTALAMFTDERLAGEFAAASGLIGLLAVKVAIVPQFQELLLRLPLDTTHLAFDPPTPGAGRGSTPVVPVREILATLQSVADDD